MARDIRSLFEEDCSTHDAMPQGHQERFLKKLEEALPSEPKSTLRWIPIAASIVLLIGLSIFGYHYFNMPVKVDPIKTVTKTAPQTLKTLGDISPGLKKVEDYYLASINLELSKMEYTSETKELFDGYLLQLDELDKEYKRLSVELTESGPSELTVNALIDNLKFRLNLLYRLKGQLKELNPSSGETKVMGQSI